MMSSFNTLDSSGASELVLAFEAMVEVDLATSGLFLSVCKSVDKLLVVGVFTLIFSSLSGLGDSSPF